MKDVLQRAAVAAALALGAAQALAQSPAQPETQPAAPAAPEAAVPGAVQGAKTPPAGREVDPVDVQVPPGYKVEVVAKGLDWLSDITFGPNGEMYAAVVGGHTYGTVPEKAPPARIIQLLPGGETKTIVGPEHVIPLKEIVEADPIEFIEIDGKRIPTAYDLPEGIIMPITGVTHHDGKLYISHRTRISTYDLSTDELKTIVDDLPSWGEFLNYKPIFGPDGKMHFMVSTQGNLGPIGAHFMKVISIFGKPLAREVPCEDVTLRGVNWWVENGFTKDIPHDAELSGAYVPFGFFTKYGQEVQGLEKCNGAFFRADPDGSNLERIAWGLRSNFGYAFSKSGRLVATQNSCNPIPPRRVYDDYEPIYEIHEGAWYGWPEYCSSIPITDERFILPNDPDFPESYGFERPEWHTFALTEETRARLLDGAEAPPSPLARLTPHAAAEGMVFGREAFGLDPENEILVAEMGSILPIDRDEQPGFRVQKVDLQTGEATDFMRNKVPGPASMTGNKGLERPVQVAWGPDGALYVVDFGVINITQSGMQAIPNSAVIWKVVRTDQNAQAQPTKETAASPRGDEPGPTELYAEWDVDGNGVISREEFQEALGQSGLMSRIQNRNTAEPEAGAEARTPVGKNTPEKLTKEELQELAPPVGYLKARKDLQDPLTLLGGPVEVNVTQTAGATRIILPGQRELDMRVFGTPDLPRSFAGTPMAEGVPLSMRKEENGEYTLLAQPSPASDEWVEAPAGRLDLHAVDISATDGPGSRDQIHLEAEWKGPDGNTYAAKCDKVIPIGVEYPVFGGVVTNHILHGFTRIATPLMPTEFAYVATWCMGTIWKNGAQVDGPRPIHTMLTEYVRNADYELAHDENVSPKRTHFHLMVPAVKPGKEQWEFEVAPVSTGYTLPNGKEMPFWHVMFEDVEVAGARLAAEQTEQQR